MGHFLVKAKNKLSDMNIGDKLSESDFATITPEGTFVQLEYIEDEVIRTPYEVKPGLWAINKSQGLGLHLAPTSFVSDKILDSFVNTKNITDKIDCFFNKLHIYAELGFEVAKRAALLYGPAGTGKSTSISVVANKYVADKKTAVVIWHTDKFEAFEVKDFIKRFSYVGVDKMILIAEDIGGVEVEAARIKSESSLLSLLDNQEKTFSLPVFILATTNYPANFMGNLTNRPNRFDDKIEVGYPDAKQRAELLKFFKKEELNEEEVAHIMDASTKEFSAAHIREIVIRSKIYDKTIPTVIMEMVKEIDSYKKGFVKGGKMGIDWDN